MTEISMKEIMDKLNQIQTTMGGEEDCSCDEKVEEKVVERGVRDHNQPNKARAMSFKVDHTLGMEDEPVVYDITVYDAEGKPNERLSRSDLDRSKSMKITQMLKSKGFKELENETIGEEEMEKEFECELGEGSEEDREKRKQKRDFDNKKRRKDDDDLEETEETVEEGYVDRNDYGVKRIKAEEYDQRACNYKGENDHIANRYVQAGYGDNPLQSKMVEGIIKRLNFDEVCIEDIEEALHEAYFMGQSSLATKGSFKDYLKEKKEKMKYIVFAKGKEKDAKWIHHFSADTKEDADSEAYSLRNGGEIVKIIRAEDQNWNAKSIDAFLKEKGVIKETETPELSEMPELPEDEDCTVSKRGDYVGVKGKDGKVKFVKKFQVSKDIKKC